MLFLCLSLRNISKALIIIRNEKSDLNNRIIKLNILIRLTYFMKTSQYLTGVIIMCIFTIYYLSDFCTLNPIHGINDYIDLKVHNSFYNLYIELLNPIKYTKMNISFNEQTITAKAGEKFNIDIPSNPTTGYTWVIENDQQKLKLISRDMIMVDSKNLGSKGTERFIFEALSEGETSVYMKYKRPWENVSLSENIYKIQIIK